jgi:hypothetical protein
MDVERRRGDVSWMMGRWRPREGETSTMYASSVVLSYLGDSGGGTYGLGSRYMGGGADGGGEGGALMTTTRSLDLDLERLLRVPENKASITTLLNGLLFVLDLGCLSSIISTIGEGAAPDDRGGVRSCEMMNSDVGSPYCIYRTGCGFTTCRSHGSSG